MKPFTIDHLKAMGARGYDAQRALDWFNLYWPDFKLNTLDRTAQAIGQIYHESGKLYYTLEQASGDAYEGRVKDLGNTQPGDGRLFKGRGFIQLTGRGNYAWATHDLKPIYGVDFIKNPRLVEQPQYAALTACWFLSVKTYKGKPLYYWMDKKMAKSVSLAVNGGTNGLADRLQLTDKAYTVFRDLF